jgi:predicted MFS family arabinose efflux permease
MSRLREPLLALREVFRNPNLRRIQLAWVGSITGQYAYSIALAVYAYRHGGPTAVGVVVVIRMVPAAVVSPFAAIIGDRSRRELVMLTADLVRAAAVGGSALLVLGGGPVAAVYALAALISTVGTVFHPAQAALLPSLARSAEELSAANVASSSIESVGGFVGPAIGGFVLAASSVEIAFVVTAATFLWSALMVARLRPEQRSAEATTTATPEGTTMRRELLAGFRTVFVEPELRLIVGLYAAQTVVAGGLGVLIVVMALRLLELGNAGVGYLNSAVGVGGLIGAAVTLALVARRRLAADFGIGVVLWGIPLLVIGLWPQPVVALLMLGLLGLGNTLVDVSALTLLQRSVANDVLARVFGVVEGLTVGTMALGAVAAPLLVSAFGTRTALVATGLFLPALAAIVWRRLAAIDRKASVPTRQLELLRGITIFAALPAPTLEHLAHALRELHFAAGSDIVRVGERGEDFFIVDSGLAEVLVDGTSKPVESGDFFGEIALLRDVPRTATVRAVTDVTLYALGRDEFIGAVTGHPPSRDAADTVIGERLSALRAGTLPA